MLVLRNMRMVLSNVRKKKRKKKREPPNVTKVQSHVMLVLHNETAKCEEKIKSTTECEKN